MNFQKIKKILEGELEASLSGENLKKSREVLNRMFDAFEECAENLREREKKIEVFMRRVQEFRRDLEALDSASSFYETASTYEYEGNEYVRVEDLTERECEVLSWLQLNSSCHPTNDMISKGVGSFFNPVKPRSVSMTLTRLKRKGVIKVEFDENDQRSVEIIYPLEAPKEFYQGE